jgi:uncharacterized membrane protein YpjA
MIWVVLILVALSVLGAVLTWLFYTADLEDLWVDRCIFLPTDHTTWQCDSIGRLIKSAEDR